MKSDKLLESTQKILQNKLQETKVIKTEDEQRYSRDAAQMIDDLRSIAEDIISWSSETGTNSGNTIYNIGYNLDKYADIIAGIYFKEGPLADKIENEYIQKYDNTDEEDLKQVLVNKLDI